MFAENFLTGYLAAQLVRICVSYTAEDRFMLLILTVAAL